MNVRLGINPLTWTIDDLPEVGGETSLETCLREARAAGFDGVELGCKFPRTAPELKAALAPHGLALVSGWYSANLLERDVDGGIRGDADAPRAPGSTRLRRSWWSPRPRAASMATGARGCRSARCSPPPTGRSSAARLDELGARLQDAGLKLAYHHHMGTVVQTEDEVDRLMDSCDDAVGSPARYRSSDLRGRRSGFARRHAMPRGSCTCIARTCAVPCSTGASIAIRSFLDAVLDGVFTVPGDGCVDYPGDARADRACKIPRLARRRSGAGPERGALRCLRESGLPESPPLRGAPLSEDEDKLGFAAASLGSALAAAALRPFRGFAAAPGYPRLMEGPMIGAVTSDSITFWGRASGEFEVDVEYSTDPLLRAPQRSQSGARDGGLRLHGSHDSRRTAVRDSLLLSPARRRYRRPLSPDAVRDAHGARGPCAVPPRFRLLRAAPTRCRATRLPRDRRRGTGRILLAG